MGCALNVRIKKIKKIKKKFSVVIQKIINMTKEMK